jgi:hypothetical protein
MSDYKADDFLAQPELAKVLRRSEGWCERARWAGTGPAYCRAGRKPLYKWADVLAWLESTKRTWTRQAA